jgi:Fe-S cluster assembly protein SufB
MEFTGITFAGKGQNLDTGMKVVHTGRETSSAVNTKSISKDGGISTFRSAVVVGKNAKKAKSSVSCASLMLDRISRSDTIPLNINENNTSTIEHEAKVSKISEEELFYLMSRGLSESQATEMIVMGFLEPFTRELPMARKPS